MAIEIHQYRVDIVFAYEQAGMSDRKEGYELVFAGSPESAKLVAKARALQSLKQQGAKLVFIDFKDPVRVD